LLDVPEATVDELEDTMIPDERLELIFTCCHPALALRGQVALTLRALGGLATAGRTALERALALRGRGPYVLQAAIASLQTEQTIDWDEVAVLYEQLAAITGSPVVELNRAVAVAQGGDPERALELVEGLDLEDYQYLHSTRGELLHRLGRRDEARGEFERALTLAATEPERRFLNQRIAEL
jgi:RNA polymerase sigma-70 factor (ECF subfamily)